MVRRLISYIACLLCWLPGSIYAQQVLYSESIHARLGNRVQVIGRSEHNYWIVKLEKQKSKDPSAFGSKENTAIKSFGLLDTRLHELRNMPATAVPGTIKQWMIAGKTYMDRVVLTSSSRKTRLICNRYYAAEQEPRIRQLDSLPFSANPSNFLLVRSSDLSKILLVGFETSVSTNTRVHAILFDSDWHILYHQVISQPLFSQPCIQDEEIGFPAEAFDNLPIKLADNGEWIMAAPSRISQNYSLFHACGNGVDYYFSEIPVSPFYSMEDIAMSIENEKEEMSVGFLSGYKFTTLKNVQIYHYSIKDGRFDFDTSFHFNTQLREIRNKNLTHEIFMSVPNGGFMFLKEYGSAIDYNKPDLPWISAWETPFLLANYTEINFGKNQWKPGYTRNPGLAPIPFVRNRGDLNIFYFPAISNDSIWSGMLDMEQTAESNNPSLSYLVIPEKDKFYLIYNSREFSGDPIATTTTLNKMGKPIEEGVVFWKMNRMLDFQKARQFSAHEVAIPYLDPQESGFAIIRLGEGSDLQNKTSNPQ